MSILVFREGTIRKICQLCTFQMTTRLSWSSWTIPKKLLEIATVVNLNIKEISVSLKHFRLQLFWKPTWWWKTAGNGFDWMVLLISFKAWSWDIHVANLMQIRNMIKQIDQNLWMPLGVKKGRRHMIESFVSLHLFLKCINLVPQRTPSFFSKLFEASPGLWKKRSTGSGGKATGGPKKNTGVAMVDCRDWYQER